jgi:hypothetical protein
MESRKRLPKWSDTFNVLMSYDYLNDRRFTRQRDARALPTSGQPLFTQCLHLAEVQQLRLGDRRNLADRAQNGSRNLSIQPDQRYRLGPSRSIPST